MTIRIESFKCPLDGDGANYRQVILLSVKDIFCRLYNNECKYFKQLRIHAMLFLYPLQLEWRQKRGGCCLHTI